MSDLTIRYYDEHAKDFVAGTENADMRECRERFLRWLKPGQKILDAGCGSGRDVIAFQEAGYEVEAFDASAEICRIASERTGIEVRQLRFEDLQGEDQYNGIWACASLLHVKPEDLPDVLGRLFRLLSFHIMTKRLYHRVFFIDCINTVFVAKTFSTISTNPVFNISLIKASR